MKRFLAGMLALSMTASLAGCASNAASSSTEQTSQATTDTATSTADTATTETLPVMGDVIQYDPNQPVNDGKDIDIEFWYWTGAANLFEDLANSYMAIHPNVNITLVENPYDDYWTKLPLALQGNDGPAIFNVHNSKQELLLDYLAPYEIPTEDLEKEFVGTYGHEFDGKVYFVDYGLMTATMYYNTDMWEAAGLTKDDIPKTWDEFREVAKKLTIRDDAGNLVQAGFSYNGGIQGDVLGMQYQYGQNLFNDDGTISLNNEAMHNVIQRLKDIYEVDGSGDYNFGNNSGDNFGQGTVAMYLGWGFMTNVLTSNFPELNFDCFEIPRPRMSPTLTTDITVSPPSVSTRTLLLISRPLHRISFVTSSQMMSSRKSSAWPTLCSPPRFPCSLMQTCWQARALPYWQTTLTATFGPAPCLIPLRTT